jgi:hypothetical protein
MYKVTLEINGVKHMQFNINSENSNNNFHDPNIDNYITDGIYMFDGEPIQVGTALTTEVHYLKTTDDLTENYNGEYYMYSTANDTFYLLASDTAGATVRWDASLSTSVSTDTVYLKAQSCFDYIYGFEILKGSE